VNLVRSQPLLLLLVDLGRHLFCETRRGLSCGPSEPQLEVADQQDQGSNQPVYPIVEEVEKLPHQPKVPPLLLQHRLERELESFGGGVEMFEEGGLWFLESFPSAVVDIGDRDLIGDNCQTNQGTEFDEVLKKVFHRDFMNKF
jgi:hypothetical protein